MAITVLERELVHNRRTISSTYFIEFIQNNCELLDNYSIGQTVRIGINIRGREWESPDQGIKYFNSIQGWRIEIFR